MVVSKGLRLCFLVRKCDLGWVSRILIAGVEGPINESCKENRVESGLVDQSQ